MNFFNLWIWEHIEHTIRETKWVVLISINGLKHIHKLFLHVFWSVLGLLIFVRVVVASVVIERKKIKGKISQKNKAIEIYKEKIDFYYYFWVFISLNIFFLITLQNKLLCFVIKNGYKSSFSRRSILLDGSHIELFFYLSQIWVTRVPNHFPNNSMLYVTKRWRQ